MSSMISINLVITIRTSFSSQRTWLKHRTADHTFLFSPSIPPDNCKSPSVLDTGDKSGYHRYTLSCARDKTHKHAEHGDYIWGQSPRGIVGSPLWLDSSILGSPQPMLIWREVGYCSPFQTSGFHLEAQGPRWVPSEKVPPSS
jgi:hypothetical protein